MAGEQEFGVSFTRSVRELQQLTAELSVLGKDLDGVEVKTGALSKSYSRHLNSMLRNQNELRRSLTKLGVDAETAGSLAEASFKRSSTSLLSMAQATTNAAAKADALRHKESELANQLNQMAKDQEYTKWQQKTAAMHTKTAEETRYLRHRLEELNGEQGIHNASLKATVAARERAVTAEAKQSAQLIELRSQLERLNSAEGQEVELLKRQVRERRRSISAMADEAEASERGATAQERKAQVSQNYHSIVRQLIRGEREMAVTGEKLAWGYERLTQEQAHFTAGQNRARNAIEASNRAMVEGEQNLHRYTGANAQAAMAAEQLAASESRAANRRTQELNELRQAMEERARAEDRVYATTERLNRADAQTQVVMERKNRTIELQNRETLENARATQVMTNREALYAKQLRESIALQERRAALASKTNMQLMGMGSLEGGDRIHREMRLNAQAAAMFRAGLGGLNASIGIYTSATVAAAAATYAFASALRNTLTSGMEFTEMMSRAEAIMMTGTGSITEAGRSMEALELQVRALGQSTVFTATEVSGGLVDLGMAGLSASDSMRALKPALDLASIGGVNMSKAADIATNVMTSFKLEASDLTGVVDILATAVTSSNTNIEQLANALSYVGPAAQAAGFGIKDTTAAIELLSNAGIKSSKAGTGLRRFMLNIQNPTKKGAAVLEEYGIGLQDATGNTRGLIDILGQFNSALHKDGITPSERMAATVDLVGVRAASAVSRMISSVDELSVFRRGLDDAAGAAEEMRETIEDNLTADWKKVKSSFEELQIEVFDEFQWHLRSTALELTNFFQTLTVKGEDGISQLDRMIGALARFTDIAQGALIVFAGYKGATIGATMFGALALNAGKASEVLSTLTNRLSGNIRYQKMTALNVSKTNSLLQLQAASSIRSAQGVRALGDAGYYAARGLRYTGMAIKGLSMAAGGLGILYGLYEVIRYAFSDTDGYIDSHKQNIKDLQGEYETLTDKIEKTQQAKNRDAAQAQIKSDRDELAAVDNQILDLTLARGLLEAPDAIQAVDDRLYTLRQTSEELQRSFTESHARLQELSRSREDVQSLVDLQDQWSSTLANTGRELDNLDEKYSNIKSTFPVPSEFGWDKMPVQMRELRGEMMGMQEVAKGYFAFLSMNLDEAIAKSVTFSESMKEALRSQRETLAEERRFDQLSVTDKMLEKQRELEKVKGRIRVMDSAGSDQSLDLYMREEEQARELQKELIELSWEYSDLAEEGAEAYSTLLELQRDDKKSIRELRIELAGLNAERMAMIATAVAGGGQVDVEAYNALLKDQAEILKEIGSAEDERRKESKRALDEAQREKERRESEAKTLYEDLRGDFDPVRKELDQYKDQLAMLDSLRNATGENAISQEDYNDAVDALSSRFRENLTDADNFLKKLKEIRSEYDGTFNTLSGLGDDRSWIQDNLRGSERDRMTSEVDDRFRDEVLSGAPKVDGLDAEVGGAWSELQRLEEQDAAQQEWYDKQLERHRQYLDTREGYEDEYSRAVKNLTKWRGDQVSQIERQEQVARLEAYGETFNVISGLTQQGLEIVKYAAGESSSAYKMMFLANKAAAIAEGIVNIELGVIKANTIDPTGVLAGITRATGYTSLGIMAGQALTTAFGSGGGGSEAPSANFSGMYDSGGTIPQGSYGIVGEVGPEIVHGPAQVTGRRATERQLKSGGGGDHIEFKPVIQVTVEGKGSDDQDAEETGRVVSRQVEAKVMSLFQRELRPKGVLDRAIRSGR